jgi:hypothetical protein
MEIAIDRTQPWQRSQVFLTIQPEEQPEDYISEVNAFNKIAVLFNDNIMIGICKIISND